MSSIGTRASGSVRLPQHHRQSASLVRCFINLRSFSHVITGASTMDHAAALQEVMSRPDFDPTTLVGDNAQEWLRHIVRMMFPGSTLQARTPQAVGKGSQNDTDKNNSRCLQRPKAHTDASGSRQDRIVSQHENETPGPAALPTKATYVSQPPGFSHPLPSLPTCNRRATLAYAVVGPRVRGKFDVKRAESFGLKAGPLRARVARGETVTVVGSDGSERSVGPGDVVGASEDPGVCFFFALFSHYFAPDSENGG
jgi:ribonuclease Z